MTRRWWERGATTDWAWLAARELRRWGLWVTWLLLAETAGEGVGVGEEGRVHEEEGRAARESARPVTAYLRLSNIPFRPPTFTNKRVNVTSVRMCDHLSCAM